MYCRGSPLSSAVHTFGALDMRIEEGENFASSGPSSCQSGSDETLAFFHPNDLYQTQLVHVLLQFVTQVLCNKESENDREM